MPIKKYSHLFVTDSFIHTENYTSPQKLIFSTNIPARNVQIHSHHLKRELESAWFETENQYVVHHIDRNGIYLQFKSFPGIELVTKSLEEMRSRQIRLLNIKEVKEKVQDPKTDVLTEEITTYATVFVAKNKKEHFFKKIEEYATKFTPKGSPKNADLINSIAEIKKAIYIDSFWQDNKNLIPNRTKEWCEVWLSTDIHEKIEKFEELLDSKQIQHKKGYLDFPERAIKAIYANKADLEVIIISSDDIAELRAAKTPASFWINLPNREQIEWAKDLLKRLNVNLKNTSVCLLDTGVNNGHPLLKPICKDDDCQAVIKEWGTYDHNKHGHGTLMAGLAAYGDLSLSLESSDTLEINHSLESVKIFPNSSEPNQKDLWGKITAEGISLAEIQAPNRKRIICIAATAEDDYLKGRPSSWSGEIDRLTSGAEDTFHRLIIISAGNIQDQNSWKDYPNAQILSSIQDPAQSWNAITVGAYTLLDQITDPSYQEYTPLAPKSGLSPFTTTSLLWDDKNSPNKPDIVMEGGNIGIDSTGFSSEIGDLSLVTTNKDFSEKGHFTYFNMTSAATAQAAWFAAKIQTEYPDFWPETVRALMIHSAKWTDKLKEQFLGRGNKSDYKTLLRICGYGVPNIDKALYSASNSLTLISEREIQPFYKNENGKYKTKEMHLYDLPWPKNVLQELPPETDIQMRITLSYFIEPGPGEIGWKDKYRYSSFGLKFDINSPTENKEQFLRRINQELRNEDEGHPGTESASNHWVIGQARDKGSIHSDIWKGTAAELADSNIIAIYPRIGWWRERHHLNMYNKKTRYSLVVTIITNEENIDIYTPVAIQIGIPISVQI